MDGDLVVLEAEQLLPQPIPLLLLPFLRQKPDHLLTSVGKDVPVPPARVLL